MSFRLAFLLACNCMSFPASFRSKSVGRLYRDREIVQNICPDLITKFKGKNPPKLLNVCYRKFCYGLRRNTANLCQTQNDFDSEVPYTL